MLKVYKRYSSFRRALINHLYALCELGSGFVATYTSNNKLIYICISDLRFDLYFQNKLYFSCLSADIDLVLYELQYLILRYGTNQILSTSF